MAYKPPKQTIADNDLKGFPSNEAVYEALLLKQSTLVSGTNIKTIGGSSVVGAGELILSASSTASATSHTINLANGPAHVVTLNSSITNLTISNPVTAGAYVLKIVQGASGGPYTITWPNTVKWPSATAPTLSTAANAVDIVTMVYVDNTFYATAATGFA